MRRISVLLYSLVGCVFAIVLIAATSPDKPNAKNDLRILELIPKLICPLAVDPGIPSDFIALSPRGVLDPCDWIYWGPKEVLEAYFEDPDSLKTSILRVKLCADIAQTGPNSFSKGFMDFLERLKKKDPKGFACIEIKWGDYPVLAIRTFVEDRLLFMAWVGLNDRETGSTLEFNLLCPDPEEPPNREHRQLWENLLVKTTQLKDGDYFRALGQDLQEGYAQVTIAGAKLKMVAEKRQSDGKLQVVVIPEGPNIEFHYVDMEECRMGATWKYGEPMVKVYGEVEVTDENFKYIERYVTSIFFKTVSEFSFKKDEENNLIILQKICDQAD